MAATDEKKNGSMNVCNCGAGGRHWTFFLLRTLLTILILMIVFWFGLAVGRMSSGYARGNELMMRGYGTYDTGSAMPMMRINGATSTTGTGSVQNY